MDDFPDELLLQIFGHIEDGEVLLDTLPLVCKRWQRLSRDPRAWQRVEVHLSTCDNCPSYSECDTSEGHEELQDAARTILHAPLLKSISFGCSTNSAPFSCPFDQKVAFSALRRCQASVSEFHFPEPDLLEGSAGMGYYVDPLEEFEDTPLEFVLDFIVSRRNQIRALILGRLLCQDTSPWGRKNPSGVALSKMRELEQLTLHVVSETRYAGELRSGLPNLRRLTVYSLWLTDQYNTSPPGLTGLLNDLLRGAAASLRHLRFEEDAAPADVLRTVRVCTELRHLSCRVQDLPLVGTLPRLQTLKLDVSSGDLAFPDSGRSLPALARYLQANTAALPELRSIHIDCNLYSNSDKDWFAAHRARVVKMFEALGVFCSDAIELNLSVDEDFPDVVEALVGPMTRLELADLYPVPVSLFPVLGNLKHLKMLTGRVSYPNGEFEKCKAIVAEFKIKHPSVKIGLKV